MKCCFICATGTIQGRIRGGITRNNHGDNWHNILSLNYDKTRKALPKSIQITKVVDSQAFFFAQTQGEMLPLVEIDVVRVDGKGNEFIEQTFKLTKVLVAAYSRRYVGAKTNVETFSLACERDEVAQP